MRVRMPPYVRETNLKHDSNPMVVHGEIPAPALLVSTSSPVVFHKPTAAHKRGV